MARVKLTEYRAKKIILGNAYRGLSIRAESTGKIPTTGHWVAKVDQGVKKRFKQGLVVVDAKGAEITKAISGWKKKGFLQFIIEPLFPHDQKEEQYFSMERVRDGIRILHAPDGGIDIEAHPEAVATYIVHDASDLATVARKSGIPEKFLCTLHEAFEKKFFTFLEINPLIVRGKEVFMLDAAVLVDSAGAFFARDAWGEVDVVKAKAKHKDEAAVEELAATTPASLKLSVINPNGALFFLLSGGGGSIVIADEAQLEGVGSLIANYGEYSGGPSREETYLYTKHILQLLIHSSAKKKALVIAGGVANFTDVKKTFLGIIDALSEVSEKLRKQGVKVFVRRGGPNEAAGLTLMRDFLGQEKLLGSVYGSDAILTKAVSDAIHFLKV